MGVDDVHVQATQGPNTRPDGERVQRVRLAEGPRDTVQVRAVGAWGARDDLDVVALSPLELGEVRHVHLYAPEPRQVEIADVGNLHNRPSGDPTTSTNCPQG